MNSTGAQTRLDSIRQVISDVESVSGQNPLIDSFMAQFLVVFISGAYEEAIENIVADFASRHVSRPEINNFVSSSMGEHFRNPDSAKIIETIARFGQKTWVDSLKVMKPQRDALDSIVSNKNKLAHGSTSTVTLLDVKSWSHDSAIFVKAVDSLLA